MMARIGSLKVDNAGVYAHLHRYFEADLQQWQQNLASSHPSGAAFPRQRILDDLRAGRTVNVPTHALPQPARQGMPPRRGRHGLAEIRPARAMVTPDDRITCSDDDWGRLWIEENGL
ncbi:hypothetical protein [Mycobacterium marseillense]|uniref:hypothetical protein n=1 Tax=Mycobacterium marseillense TaxID=701042 RepID=UPI0011A520D8|nr:hypothetical protein [Mycobacterium marseillense]